MLERPTDSNLSELGERSALEKGVEGILDFADDCAGRIDSHTADILSHSIERVDISSKQLEEIAAIQKEAKSLSARFKETVGVYLRIVVLSGLALSPSVRNPGSTSESQSFPEKLKRAKVELRLDGITSEQRKGYLPVFTEALDQGVLPGGYYPMEKLKKLVPNIILGKFRGQSPEEQKEYGEKNDAWRLYLGLPQEHATFGISDYQPVHSKDKAAYYYKINSFWNKYVFEGRSELTLKYRVMEIVRMAEEDNGHYFDLDEAPEGDPDQQAGVMGQFTVSIGKDERGSYISYYDRSDYAGVRVADKLDGILGKSFEIYDRLYYDPQTFLPIPEAKPPTSTQD